MAGNRAIVLFRAARGKQPDGQPYFVMEYVPGVPITDYAIRNG